MGKTIDHRFFVDESDLLDPDCSTGRDFVPARARQMDKNGKSVVTAVSSVGIDGREGSNSGDPSTRRDWEIGWEEFGLEKNALINC